MRTFLALSCVALVIACVFSNKCQHNDPNTCTGMTCNATAGLMVGCDHDTCTCVPAPTSCLDLSECSAVNHCEGGKHHETMHCVDGYCSCVEIHH